MFVFEDNKTNIDISLIDDQNINHVISKVVFSIS